MTMGAPFLYEVFQAVTISVLVAGCTLYCLLTLAPNGLKRPLKLALLRCPLPTFVAAWLKQTTSAGACGSNCGTCAPGAAKTRPVKWYPRKP